MDKTQAEKNQAIAEALTKAGLPRRPPDAFSYTPETAVQRARAGSVRDARLLLLLAAIGLRNRRPDFPHWLSDYVAEVIECAAKQVDVAKAMNLKPARGNSKFSNEERNKWIDYAANSLKCAGKKDFLEATAELLQNSGFSPPRPGSAWSSQAVRDAIQAHEASEE